MLINSLEQMNEKHQANASLIHQNDQQQAEEGKERYTLIYDPEMMFS